MQKCSFVPGMLVLLLFVVSCAHLPDLTGKWKQPGRSATVEFRSDNTFKAVDNQGMTVGGHYQVMQKDEIRFEIDREEAAPLIFEGTLRLEGKKLTLVSGDGEDVDVYEKVDK